MIEQGNYLGSFGSDAYGYRDNDTGQAWLKVPVGEDGSLLIPGNYSVHEYNKDLLGTILVPDGFAAGFQITQKKEGEGTKLTPLGWLLIVAVVGFLSYLLYKRAH